MPHPLSLLVFPSRLFPAHWALYMPSPSSPSTGTLLNARGNSLSGFTIEFERDYSLVDAPPHQAILLGEVEDEFVQDRGEEGGDSVPRCYLEEVVLSVGAPGGSLRKVDGGEPLGKRVRIENCQTWLREVVVRLVEKGVLGQEAIGIVDGAPKN